MDPKGKDVTKRLRYNLYLQPIHSSIHGCSVHTVELRVYASNNGSSVRTLK